MLEFVYDNDGQPTHAIVGGKEVELTDAVKNRVPSKTMGKFRDVTVNLGSTLEEMKDSYRQGSIIVDIEATHAGYTNGNNYHYLASGHKSNIDTWTEPVGKPYIVGHDIGAEDPKGRVEDANFIATGNTTGYQALDTKISDKDEVEMVLDGRALTVSTGTHAIDTVECSNCGHDMHHDGPIPIRYELSSMPSDEWLNSRADGLFGAMLGLTNQEMWEVEKSEDGTVTAVCNHMRHLDAPKGGQQFHEIFWYLHGQAADEISRVNRPADVNDVTGEFAHIREVMSQHDSIEDEELRAKLVIDELSKIPKGAVDRARFNVTSENDLWRPASANEAIDYAKKTNLDKFFDTGLWIATRAMTDGSPTHEQVRHYWEKGGRFVTTDQTDPVSPLEALDLPPGEFGAWIRASDFTEDERSDLEKAHALRCLRQ